MDVPTLTPDDLAALPPSVVAFIRWLQDRVTQLEAQNADLHARLNQDSSNSSRPPSTDPPSYKPAPPKPPSGQPPGGQTGHPRHSRLLRTPTRIVHHTPHTCDGCGQLLMGYDPNPTRRQVVDLPVIQPDVTDHYIHRITCLLCGVVTAAPVPPEAVPTYGPRLQASLALFGGEYRMSKRSVAAFCRDYLGLPISTGQICALEHQTSEALGPAVDAVRSYVQTRPTNVDETAWRQGNRTAWLWVAATRLVAVFAIYLSRSRASFQDLMGRTPAPVVTTDRYSVYSHLPAGQRQLCWAHLRRDFQAMIDRGGLGKAVGEELLKQTDAILKEWKRVRDGPLSREEFREQLLPGLRGAFETALESGVACGCAKTSSVCMELRHWRESLWTFASHAEVEPTNNAAERAVRHAVCWRKTSYGTASVAGSRFVARILTVVASCRLQGRKALEFVTESLRATRLGTPPPSLVPVGAS